jgi:hypothetical protein
MVTVDRSFHAVREECPGSRMVWYVIAHKKTRGTRHALSQHLYKKLQGETFTGWLSISIFLV